MVSVGEDIWLSHQQVALRGEVGCRQRALPGQKPWMARCLKGLSRKNMSTKDHCHQFKANRCPQSGVP